MPPKKKELQLKNPNAKRDKDSVSLNKVYGSSGTVISDGVISEEYNYNLSGLNGMDKYEQMRKSDAQCSAVLTVCELPLRSAKWSVDPYVDENGKSSDEDAEVAQFVHEALFDNRMSQTFDELLIEVFSFLAFGFSVFEKVHKIEDGMVWLKKMASRKQTTISGWRKDGGFKQQTPFNSFTNSGGVEVEIPGEKTVLFSYRREGDNFEGVSLLRPAYKHWHFKENLYKFDAVKHERQSVGIPVIYLPEDASQEDKDEAQAIVDNVRAHEQTGIVIPGPKSSGWEFEFADMKASGSNTNILESISHHNREITKIMLAQFLELGNTASGSRSLGENQSEMFLMATQSIGNYVASVFNKMVVKELVDLNFDTDRYPILKVGKIKKVNWEQVTAGLEKLANAGMVTPTTETEAYLRDLLDLPAFTDSGAVKQANANPTKKVDKPAKKEVKATEQDVEPPHNHDQVCGEFDEDYMNLSRHFNNDFIIKLQNELSDSDKKKAFKLNDFESKSPRALTFAERKVNFTSLKAQIGISTVKLEKALKDISKKQRDDILKQVETAIKDNDIKALGVIKAKYRNDVASSLTEIQKEMFEVGKKTAATEMNVKVPPTNKEVRGAMRLQNTNVSDEFIRKQEVLSTAVATEYINKKGGDIRNVSFSEIRTVLDEELERASTKAANTLTTLAITGAVNTGRTTIFERYPERIYAMQYSAIMDEKTTDHCMSLDGRVVKAGSSEFYEYSPPQHYGCRSIWVEILVEEVFKPKITGIPSTIKPSKTIDSAKLLKSPKILKNSAAVKVIQEEIADRKVKLETLVKTNQYPNRQEQHRKRIKSLERSIENKFAENQAILHNLVKEAL